MSTLPANLCPFSGRRELARFDKDFGEAVGEPVEVTARSIVWQRAGKRLVEAVLDMVQTLEL